MNKIKKMLTMAIVLISTAITIQAQYPALVFDTYKTGRSVDAWHMPWELWNVRTEYLEVGANSFNVIKIEARLVGYSPKGIPTVIQSWLFYNIGEVDLGIRLNPTGPMRDGVDTHEVINFTRIQFHIVAYEQAGYHSTGGPRWNEIGMAKIDGVRK
jgi:hypothetical protein